MRSVTVSPVSKLAKLLINRDFGLLWVGQTLSGAGDFFFDTTLILWITTGLARGQVWLPLAVSGVALAAAIPALVVSPLAGVFVDRWDKRATLLWMDAIRAVLVALLLIATGLVPLPLGITAHLPVGWKLGSIYGAIVLQTCCAQFFRPAYMALIADIVPDPERAHAMSMVSISFNLALILAPSLAAPLFLSVGATWAIVIDALSFVSSLGLVWLMRPPEAARSVEPGEKGHYLREFADGVRFFRGNRVLVVLLVAGIIFNLATGVFNAFYLLFVLVYAHSPVSLAGLFAASYGGAVIVGSILIVMVAKRIGEGAVFWLSLLAWGLVLLPFARMTSFLPALLLNCLLGLANAGINVVVGPLLMRFTLREYMGRVTAVFTPVIQAAQLLAVLLAGFVASTLLAGLHAHVWGMSFGPVDTIFTGAGLLAIAAGVYAWLALRGGPVQPAQLPVTP